MTNSMIESLVSIFVRVAVGIVTGGVAAMVGYFIGWFFLLQPWMSSTQSFVVLTISIGVGAGLGAFAGWIKLDEGVASNLPALGLTLFGAMVGSWAGLYYSQEVFGVAFRSTNALLTAMPAAGIASNVPPLIAFSIREFRR